MGPLPGTVLLVEDNDADARLITDILRERGVRVFRVEDGDEALEFLRRKGKFASAVQPQLIVLDLNLPKVGGREVLANIKADERLKVIPVVVLTSSRDANDIDSAYEHFANCYITKPFNLQDTEEVLRTIERFWFSVATLPPSAR